MEDRYKNKTDAIYDPYITSISCGPLYAKDGEFISEINARLIADAPLLLVEVKRLQAWKNEMTDIINEAKGKENADDSRPTAIWWNLQYKLKEMLE